MSKLSQRDLCLGSRQNFRHKGWCHEARYSVAGGNHDKPTAMWGDGSPNGSGAARTRGHTVEPKLGAERLRSHLALPSTGGWLGQLFFFDTGFLYTARTLVILLPQPPWCWDYKHVQACPVLGQYSIPGFQASKACYNRD